MPCKIPNKIPSIIWRGIEWSVLLWIVKTDRWYQKQLFWRWHSACLEQSVEKNNIQHFKNNKKLFKFNLFFYWRWHEPKSFVYKMCVINFSHTKTKNRRSNCLYEKPNRPCMNWESISFIAFYCLVFWFVMVLKKLFYVYSAI